MKDGKLKELTGKEVEEMRDKKPLPIGIDDFKTIIEEDYYYADKTEMIEKLLDDGAGVSLFTRPRRFGKTLNMSMLNYFFNLKKIYLQLKKTIRLLNCNKNYRIKILKHIKDKEKKRQQL